MKFKNILGGAGKANIESIKSDFVSLASHQLRTPLSAIKWYAEMLMAKKHGELSEKQQEYLREIYQSNQRAINLVNDLLDVSRIQEGQIHLELRPTKIESVIGETIDSFARTVKASGLAVNFEIINGPLPPVEVDQEKLKRVIINLLSNSVKYTPQHGAVRITVARDTTRLTISVTDTGVGIPEEDQKRIFDKFFRSPNVIKMAPDGTGLGLFIAKSLIEAMGGKIGFHSEEGHGTTFYFTLPLKS
ncbi:MAG: HAMP domain-containing histidine kinase [Candidatus Doudnabacteria bacterium]|nr:HAMP domain-containing histidine kinase [Candidatus Doudnabacteria bacterium]